MPPRSQMMNEAKLRRIYEHNERLREQLDLPRIKVSEAGYSLIVYCNSTQDKLVPSVWGHSAAGYDPYTDSKDGSCCHIM